MSSTVTNTTTTITARPAELTIDPPHLLRTGIAAGVVAAAATCLVAAAAHAAGADLMISGERIPLSGFATLTLAGALIGIALAAACLRWADRPRSTFVRTTITLTVLSIVPDMLADATASTRIALAATHFVAAAIIVPALATRLTD